MPTNLQKIDHIVVLMMENRSFDHMLGYLSLKHHVAVDGLTGRESNPDLDGHPIPVNPLPTTLLPTDLGHSSADVREQLRGGNQGFVTNYLHQAEHGAGSLAMGYHDEEHLWAYHELARRFAVCDRWFASLPGPTIPNRLFAVAGQSAGDTDQPPHGMKIYHSVKSVFDCLDAGLPAVAKSDRWGYYFHDLPMLALLQQHIRELLPGGPRRIRKVGSFYERARRGRLPAVSWIDPNFTDIGSSNDDHPPKSDLYDGQLLVAAVYNALLEGGNGLWEKSLLIVTYDEHGGLYDHVAPPGTGDAPPFDRYGARVPAIVASAWIPSRVDKVVRDHASILRTILNRFVPAQALTPRVDRAEDLGSLLSLGAARRDAVKVQVPPRPVFRRRALRVEARPTALDNFLTAYRAELERQGAVLDPPVAAPRRRKPPTRAPVRRRPQRPKRR